MHKSNCHAFYKETNISNVLNSQSIKKLCIKHFSISHAPVNFLIATKSYKIILRTHFETSHKFCKNLITQYIFILSLDPILLDKLLNNYLNF